MTASRVSTISVPRIRCADVGGEPAVLVLQSVTASRFRSADSHAGSELEVGRINPFRPYCVVDNSRIAQLSKLEVGSFNGRSL